MKYRALLRASLFVLTFSLAGGAYASFEWGGDCESGEGHFIQSVERGRSVFVGEIPEDRRNVRISLTSDQDIDIQLVDQTTGTRVVHWPNGILRGPTEQCALYAGVEYCYSGYNGIDGNPGNEWVEIRGDSNRALNVYVYAFEAGVAPVVYSWEALPTCHEKGKGTFSQAVPRNASAKVGVIPAGKVNVRIKLKSVSDIDIQLFAGDLSLVKWPSGMLNGPRKQELEYEGMQITWSGYNGDGTGPGNEYLHIDGVVSRDLTMKVFGYFAGSAQVSYEWGVGAGETCVVGDDETPCPVGLYCKGLDVSGTAGTCHVLEWCGAQTFVDDCSMLAESSEDFNGPWACEQFKCVASTEITLSRLLEDPKSYIDEVVTITYPVSVMVPMCTLRYCPPEEPCCNLCAAGLAFQDGEDQVSLNGLGCSGDNCSMDCDYDQGDLIRVTGVVGYRYGTVEIDVIDSGLVDAEVSLEALIHDPKDYEDAWVVVTHPVSVSPAACTKRACPPDDPCCNLCAAGLLFVDDNNVEISLLGLGCRGNECVMECDYEEGLLLRVTGIARRPFGPHISIDVVHSVLVEDVD